MDTPTLELRFDAGRLILASDAVHGIYHVQDPITKQFLPIVAERATSWRLRSGWLKKLQAPALGAAAGMAVLAVAGFYNHWWVARPIAVKERAVASLPIARPASAANPVDEIMVVDSAYPAAQPRTASTALEQPDQASPEGPGPLPPVPVAPSTAAPPRPPGSAAAAVATPPSKPPSIASPAAPRPASDPRPAAGKQIPVPEKRATGAAASLDKVREEPPVVFNEPAPVRPIVNEPTKAAAVASAAPAVRASAPTSAQRPSGAGGVRLVAIKDAATILVGLPGQLVPVQMKPGVRLPNGAAITSADPVRGVVLLDNGASLALE